jgi:SMC interacting uncharacterized protein involved in chromosome segregation
LRRLILEVKTILKGRKTIMSIDDSIKKTEAHLEKMKADKAAREQKKIDTLEAKVKAKSEKAGQLQIEIDDLQEKIALLRPESAEQPFSEEK